MKLTIFDKKTAERHQQEQAFARFISTEKPGIFHSQTP